MEVTDIIEHYIIEEISKKEKMENKLSNVLNSLSSEEIKVLKKKLDNY